MYVGSWNLAPCSRVKVTCCSDFEVGVGSRLHIILMASAGYDPRVVPPMLKTHDDHTDHSGSVKMGIGGAVDFPIEDLSAEARALFVQRFSGETRAQQLLQPEVMEKAFSIYKEVLAQRGKKVR